MLQLYYTAGSPPSRAVLQTIRVLGIEVEVKNLDLMKGEQMSSEFLKLNPMHQVPVLVDGDFVVTESRAIMAYLVNSRKPGSELYPTDAKKRALIDQRMYFESVNLFELAASILRPIFFRGDTNIPTDKIEKLRGTLKLLESFLDSNPYFAGENPTIADISILSSFIMVQNTFKDFAELPNLTAWFQRCKSLPGFEENSTGTKAIRELMAAKGMSPISLA